jgi:hypothetical protein
MRTRAILLIGGLASAVATLAAAPVVSQSLADACAKKVVIVQQQAGKPSKTPRTTPFAEGELNSYLRFKATDQLPTGLMEPVLTLHGAGRVTGTAVVDLDIVRQKQGSGSWFDPTTYLTGRLPVTATGIVRAADGFGKFELESAEVSGVPIPKSFLAQMVNFFTRTADNPRGSSIDDSFELPADIRRIDVEPGRALVIQ